MFQLFGSTMRSRVVLTGITAFILPLIIHVLLPKCRKQIQNPIRIILLTIYCLIIILFTLARPAGTERQINLTPFWSYSLFSRADIRWEVYMNVFLFIPFGFLLPLAINRNMWQTIFAGMLLSIAVEIAQFLFCLGLCEFDDVFHNAIGTAMGFGYWVLLKQIGAKQ